MTTPSVTILQDTREQAPLGITAYPVVVATLSAGDYSVAGFHDFSNPGFIVERKSIPDLIASLTRERKRFWKEVEALRRFRFAALLIEGTRDQVEMQNYRGLATPAAILASLDAIEVRAGIHILWASDAEGAARRLEGLVRQFCRGIEKDWKRLSEPAAGA
jgi:ERCC4-type nuclease